jgi:hypothetical protein
MSISVCNWYCTYISSIALDNFGNFRQPNGCPTAGLQCTTWPCSYTECGCYLVGLSRNQLDRECSRRLTMPNLMEIRLVLVRLSDNGKDLKASGSGPSGVMRRSGK